MTLIYGRGRMGSGARSLRVGPQVRRFWAEQDDGTREAACGRHRHPQSGYPRHERATPVAVNPSSALVSTILSELDSVFRSSEVRSFGEPRSRRQGHQCEPAQDALELAHVA